MTTFADRLKELKERKRVEWPEVAKKTGICQATIMNYACGRREPNLSYLIWLADYFGVSLDYLAGRDGP